MALFQCGHQIYKLKPHSCKRFEVFSFPVQKFLGRFDADYSSKQIISHNNQVCTF
jgi:hypothetical protein